MCTDIFVLASLVHVRLYENYFNLSCNCVFVRTVKFWPKSKRGLKTAFSSANGGRGCRKFEGFGGNLGGFVPPPPLSPQEKVNLRFALQFQIQVSNSDSYSNLILIMNLKMNRSRADRSEFPPLISREEFRRRGIRRQCSLFSLHSLAGKYSH